jgi:tRNA threonylcarbamoyladenosine biosynthesis protein TsaE
VGNDGEKGRAREAGDIISALSQGAAFSIITFTTHSAEETIALGRRIAKELRPGSLVLLRGDLGAGKTTLVKGIAESFDAAEAESVTSPTFTLIHEYRGPDVTLYHIDLYRIDTQRGLDTLALDDLRDERSILLIEWGEKFARFRHEKDAEIAIEHLGGDERRLSFNIPNPRSG